MYQIRYHFFREPSHTKIQCVQQVRNNDAAYYFAKYIIAEGWILDGVFTDYGARVDIEL